MVEQTSTDKCMNEVSMNNVRMNCNENWLQLKGADNSRITHKGMSKKN